MVSIEIAADGAWSLRGSLRGIHGAPRYTSRPKLGTLGFPPFSSPPGMRRAGLLATLPPALDRSQLGGHIDAITGDASPTLQKAQLRLLLTHREGLRDHPRLGAKETFCGEPVIPAKGRLSGVI